MAPSASKVFISYNRADRDWAEWIAGAIDRSGCQPIIQAWDFRPGQNFVLRMQEATTEAALTIAVLSEAYLKAEFTQPEWAAAFAQDPTGEKRQLIPVRVTPCTLQGLLKPIIYVDLVNLSEQDAERALLDGLKPSGKPAQPPPFPGKRAESPISTAPFPPSLARLHGVPDLPPHYLPREEVLTGLKEKLLSGDASVAITGQGQAVGVQGMGGIGKTVLAAALAHDSEVRQAFHNGIFWLTAGQKPNLLELQNQLLRQLTGLKETFISVQEAKDALHEALEGKAALLVIDDAWNVDHADAFFVTAPPVRLIITTRNAEVLIGLDVQEHRVDVLSPSDALKMLAAWVGEQNPVKLPLEAADAAKECGYLPLALAMIGAMIRLRPTAWKDALMRLQRADLGAIKRAFPGYPYPDLLRAIEVSIDGLEPVDQERYLDLAAFPEDQPIPEGPLAILWKLDETDTRDCMTRFVARSLARRLEGEGHEMLILHDLQRDLIRKRCEKNLPGLHLRLVEGWDALPQLPDLYAWRWMGYHLVQAGRKDDLRQLLLNFNWLQAKLEATNPNAVIADYDYLQGEEELSLIQSALLLSGHVLAHDSRQLPGQLIGRLFSNTAHAIQALRKQAAEGKAWPWFRPLNCSLTAPGGPIIRTLEGHTGRVSAVAVTPDGRRAVSGSDDETLRLWDVSTGQTIRTLKGHTGVVIAVAMTPDGRRAVSGSSDHTLRLWNLESGQRIRSLKGHTAGVNSVAMTPDGRRAVSASDDWTLRLWDVSTGKTIRTLEGHTAWVSAVAATFDGHRAVSGSGDGTLRLWDLESGQMIRSPKGHTAGVNSVAMAPDGRRAVSGSGDGTLRLWDLESGQRIRNLKGHTAGVSAVAMTPDGRRAVSGSRDEMLLLWDLQSGQRIRTLEGHSGEVSAVAVTRDGRRAVSASKDRTLRLWDLESGETIRTLKGHTAGVWAVAVTPDGRRAVSGTWNRTLRLWDLKSGQRIRSLKGHTAGVRAVAVIPDGRRAVSGSYDHTLRLWDLESGQTIRTLKGHTAEVSAVVVTLDGRRAVSGSYDHTLRLWDLESGNEIATFTGDGEMNSCDVTRDGQTVIAGDGLGRLHFLRLVEADPTMPPIGDTKIPLLHRKEQASDFH